MDNKKKKSVNDYVVDESGYMNDAMKKKYEEIMERKKQQEQQKQGRSNVWHG